MGKNIKTKTYFSIFANICVLMMICGSTHSQDLCNSSESILDGFELLTPAVGCGPYTVKLEDKTGGSDIKYIYYYGGQDKSELDGLSPLTSLENTYFKPEETSNYTILQYGKKPNGEDFYSCKNVTVRIDNSPKFSYTLCNNSKLTVDIPENALNDFDYYEIDWGTGAKENVNTSNIPFSKTVNTTLPVTINVEGFYTGVTLNCGTPSSTTLTSTSKSDGDLKFHPNIDKIELLDETSGELTLSGSFRSSGYSIYKSEKGQNPYQIYLEHQSPGIIPFDIDNPEKSYCFHAEGSTLLGCLEVSAEICTIPLNEIEGLEKENTLTWENYKTNLLEFQNSTTYGRFITFNTEVLTSERGQAATSKNILNSNNPYTESIDCKKDFCYRIKIITEGQLYYHKFNGESLSNERCISRKDFQPDSINNLFVSVVDNAPVVKFTDDSHWFLEKEKFYLYHGQKIVDSTDASGNTLKSISDASSESQCFQVQYLDECGSRSKLSPEVCSILLETDNASELFWQESLPFSPSPISAYEVLAIDEADPSIRTSIFTGTDFLDGTYEPNLENYESEASYIIRAITSSGQESYSNIVNIPIETEFYFPTAFSPKSSISENQSFRIFGNLSTLTSFEIKIYNRWGLLVFFSEDPFFIWDGTYKGNTLPSGSFTYSIKAKNKIGEAFSLSHLINIIN